MVDAHPSSSLAKFTLLALLGVVALGLRVWGLGYGLPNLAVRPDEDRIIGPASAVLREGRVEPATLVYPSLLIYLDAGVLAAAAGFRQLLGWGAGLEGLFAEWPRVPYLICRGVSAVAGAGTALLTYALARALAPGKPFVGWVAGVVVAANYLHVRDSHWATTDATLTFLVALTLLLSLYAFEGRPGALSWAGVVGGLAASTKYQGLLVLAAPILVAFWVSPSLSARVRRVATVALLAAVAFAVTSPYQVKRGRAVLETIRKGQRDVIGHRGERAYLVHARLTFPEGFGLPVLAAAGLGLGWGVRRRHPGTLVLMAFALPWSLVFAPATWVFPRYVTPLVPVVAALAAQGVAVLGVATVTRVVVAIALLAGPGLARSIAFDRIAARPDTRLLAVQWIDEHLPPRTRVQACGTYGMLEVGTRPYRTIDCQDPRAPVDWGMVIVLPSHPYLGHFHPVADEVRQTVANLGKRLAVFDPFVPGRAAEAEFYPGDAFFIPFAGLGAVERGGPLLEVWALHPVRPLPGRSEATPRSP